MLRKSGEAVADREEEVEDDEVVEDTVDDGRLDRDGRLQYAPRLMVATG